VRGAPDILVASRTSAVSMTHPGPEPNPPHDATPGAPLRVGVMLDARRDAAWVAKVLADIRGSGIAEIVLVVRNATPAPRRSLREKLGLRLAEFGRKGLYNLYERVDARRHRAARDAFAETDLDPVLAGVEELPVRPIQKKFTDRFEAEDIRRIREVRLDVLLRFGFRIIKGEILQCARYGVWSYHHGDNREYRGGPALFWEIYERNPVSGTILQVLSEDLDAGKILARTISATDPSSLYRNRNATYWKSAEMVMRCLRELQQRGWEEMTARPLYRETAPYPKAIYRAPTNAQMARFLGRMGMRAARRRSRSLVMAEREQWYLALVPRPAKASAAPRPGSAIRQPMPDDRFYADPFLHRRGNKEYLFFEDYPFATQRGVISVAEVTAEGRLADTRVALERPYHLSYPFVFEWQGGMYMVPESKGNRTVELYRATRFPDEWTLETTLLSGVQAVDATLLEHDSRWWMFVNIGVEGASTWDELHLYHAETPLGPWRAHPRNPVVSDVRCARPAGRIFREEGSLVRPAQDCSVSYGHAIRLQRITTLTEEEYAEEPLGRITPEWAPGATGTHTFNLSERWLALDAKETLRRWRWQRRWRGPGF
jgi:hypothetical protein